MLAIEGQSAKQFKINWDLNVLGINDGTSNPFQFKLKSKLKCILPKKKTT